VHRCSIRAKDKTILTNADGRTDAPLLMDAELTVGVYELVFKVGEYFACFSDPLSDPPFLDRIPLNLGLPINRTIMCHYWFHPGRIAPIGEADVKG